MIREIIKNYFLALGLIGLTGLPGKRSTLFSVNNNHELIVTPFAKLRVIVLPLISKMGGL